MRARRPLRVTRPSFEIALPAETAAPEVHVQQRNEDEINKFFIDVNDTIVSPIVTTDPTFSLANLPTLNNVEEWTRQKANKDHLATVSGSGAAGHSSSCGPRAEMMDGEAKFIHVDKTNIFILIDGVSMFFEGRRTFTGKEDPAFLKERVKKKRAQLAASMNHSTGEIPGAQKPRNTLEEAIHSIEQSKLIDRTPGQVRGVISPASVNEGDIMSFGSPVSPNGGAVTSPAGSTPASSSSQPAALSRLFAGAMRPAHTPLFRDCVATEPVYLSEISTPVTSTSLATRSGVNGAGPSFQLGFGESPMLQHAESSSSLVSMGSTATASMASSSRHGRRHGRGRRNINADDIGHDNRSLSLEDVEIGDLIGKGSQGSVYRVALEGKLYALKCVNIDEVMSAASDVERQGRKKGLVKELNMIALQQTMPPPKYLMQMFNAVASLETEPRQLSILIELMSSNLEDFQKMIARIPQNEVSKRLQLTFAKHLAGDPTITSRIKACTASRLENFGQSQKVVGRINFDEPTKGEKTVERQTTVPEIILSFLAHDVLRGLKELHEDYHIAHCDLKPANVLLCYDKTMFKITDFGCGCTINAATGRVRHGGVDLGSMLYKAPERCAAQGPRQSSAKLKGPLFPVPEAEDGVEADLQDVVEFGAKSDVWSLGILLLELSCGVHPCNSFRTNFWNYVEYLRLSRMYKPLNWSEVFYDFIVRCVCEKEEQRWSVDQLLTHPFILKYAHVNRMKLQQFMERLEMDSQTFHKRQQQELLRQQILLSTTRQLRDVHVVTSRKAWERFNAGLKKTPQVNDERNFPALLGTPTASVAR